MKRVFIAGHNGMVGSALTRLLSKDKQTTIITRDRTELDLANQEQVIGFFQQNAIDEVYIAAAKVGGINANNTYPAEFIYNNLIIACNVIDAAHNADVQKLLFLGSSCIYPKHSEQPIPETALLTGYLEPTNEPYAIAKIAGIKLCESYNRQFGRDFRCVMPTNLYGQNDNFHDLNSHVIPGLIQRFHRAKIGNENSVKVWGTGKVKRDFLNVNDLANASLFIMDIPKSTFTKFIKPMCSHVNVGSGEEISIADLAQLVAQTVGFRGDIEFDSTKPDGTARKLLNTGLINQLGWHPEIELKDGLSSTYQWYLNQFRQV